MNERSRRIVANVARSHEEAEAWDLRFWRDLGPEARLEAMWDMALEADVWKGGDGSQPRLQRSVCRLIRRRAVNRPTDIDEGG